jgi:microcystin-dependent protein
MGISSGLAGAVGAVPVGVVNPFAGSTAPSGWLLCFGQAVSRSQYPALFATISTTYGTGDGSTTFNVPDLRGRVVAGVDNMGGTAASRLTSTTITGGGDAPGEVGGSQTHTLTTAQIPSHNHSVPYGGSGNGAGGIGQIRLNPFEGNTNSGSTGGGEAHNNVQPTMVLNYIIKAA